MNQELTKKDIEDIIIRNQGMIGACEGLVLYQLARQCKGNIVEIGAYCGASTIILAKGLRKPYKVYSIDPHILNSYDIFKENIKREKEEDKIVPILKTSEEAKKEWGENIKIGLLWIDGNHEYEFVKKDFVLWEPLLSNGGTITLHDTEDWDIHDIDKMMDMQKNNFNVFFHRIGPTRIAHEMISHSKRFSNVKKVELTTYAKKIKRDH